MQKHLQKLLLIVAMMFVPWVTQAQTLEEYSFSTGTDTSKWIAVPTTLTSLITPGAGDYGVSSVHNLGFTFPFGEDSYTQFSVNADGNLKLGSSVTGTSNYSSPFSSSNASVNNPKINFFGCDGYCDNSHYVRYLHTADTNGDSLGVVEFCMGTYTSTTRSYLYKWQVHLYHNGKVEVVFGVAPSTAPAVSRQQGLCINASDGWLVNASHSASHFTSGSSTTITSGNWPAEGRYYTFERPYISCPRPTSITVSNVGVDAFDLSWTDTSDATSWLVQLIASDSIWYDNVEYYNLVNFTGLNPNTLYTARVAGLCSNGDTSTWRTIEQRTPCSFINTLPYQNGFEDDPYYSSVTYANAFPSCWTRINDATGTYNYYPYLYNSSTYAHSGNVGMYWYLSTSSDYANNEYAVLPGIDTNVYEISDLTLAFYAKTTSTSYHPAPIVGVMTNPNDASTFTPVYTFSNTAITTDWVLYAISFADYTGYGNFIAIKCPRPSSTAYMAIDDIFLTDEWCDIPLDVTANPGLDEVTVSWNPNGGTSFTVILGTDTITNLMDSSYTFTGLTANTLYNYSVANECTTSNSMSITGSVRTLCAAIDSLPYSYGFEGLGTGSSSVRPEIPCWHHLNNGTSSFGYPYVSSTTPHGGSRNLYWYLTTTTGTYGDYECVVLPGVDTDIYPLNTLQLRFWARSSSTSYNPVFQVGVMSNPTDINSFQPVDTIYVGNNTNWAEFTTVFNSFAGQGQFVAVKAVRPSSSWYAYTDDFTLEPIPNCPRPLDLVNTSSTDPDSMAFEWEEIGEATEWYIVAVQQGGNPDTCSTGMTVYDENAVMQLMGGQAYDVYVRSICGASDSSTWTGPITVIPGLYLMGTSGHDTLRTCRGVICDSGGPNGSYGMSEDFTLYIFPGSPDSILVISGTSYTEGTYDYIRIYDGIGTGGTQVWNDYGVSANQTFGPFTSNTGAFTITWHSDGSVVYDGFQINVRCLGQPDCAHPLDFNLVSTSTDTVTVAWSDTTSTGSYELCYGPTGMDPDTVVDNIISVFDTIYDFTTLSPTITYDIYVRSDCGTEQSWWIGPITVRPGSYNMSATGHDTVRACNITIYDDGGPLGQYSNSANSTLVVRAPHPDSLFAFSGSAYTESSLDQLIIYDGVGTSGTILWQTSSSTVSESIPLTLSSGSAITLSWHTDGSVVYDGFEVSVTCQSAPECNSITELHVTHVAGTSALLDWSIGSGNTGGDPVYYNVTVNGVTDTTSQNPYWLTGLTPGTHYYVNVQGVCATTGTSFMVSNDFVTTCLAGGDLEISGGTSSNVYYPLNASVNYSYTQEIYAASQLSGPMTISGVAYHIQSSGCSTRNISLYLGEVTQSSITSVSNYIPLSQLHLVYTGSFSGAANTWSNIYFDSTFSYTGLGNLVVALDDNTGSTGTANFYTSSGTDRAIHFHNSTDINPASPSGTTQLNTGVQNDIRFLQACDTTATCVAPNVAVFEIDPYSAYISWAPGRNEYLWDVAHKADADATWTIDTVSYANTTYTVTGLNPNTHYTFRVTADCGDTAVDGFEDARTGCAYLTSLPFTENFESQPTGSSTTGSAFVNCWNRLNNGTSYGGYPYVGSSSSYNHTSGGSKGLYWYNTTTTGSYGDYQCVVLPGVDTDIYPINTLQLAFWAIPSSSSYVPVFQIGVMSDPNDVSSFRGVDTITLSTFAWTEIEVPFTNYTGNGCYPAVKAVRPGSVWTAYVDDFRLEIAPTCTRPNNVHSTANTASTITFDWNERGSATEWEIAIETSPTAAPTADTNVISHPITFGGLTAGTNYYVYVRSICGPGDTSLWSDVINAVPGSWNMRANMTDTLRMCGGAIYDEGGPNGSYYTSNQDSYIILYPDAPNNLVSISGTSYTESSFDYLRIYDGVGNSGTELWNDYGVSSLQSFGPLTSESGPLTIYFHTDGSVYYDGFAINVSCVSAFCRVLNMHIDPSVPQSDSQLAITWDTNGSLYNEVEYGPQGFTRGTGTTLTTYTNSVVITGLSALTNYDVYVRSICSSTDTGSWSRGTFQTAMCDNAGIAQNWTSSASTTTDEYSPIGYSCYNYSYTQIIIDSAQLASLNGDITAFEFKPYNSASSYGSYYTNMNIYMANISESTFTSDFIHPDANHQFVQVMTNGNCNYTNDNWQTIMLDTTFTWDGHSNILFAVNRQHGSYSCSAEYEAHYSTGNKMAYAYNDDNAYNINNASADDITNIVGDLRLISCGGANCRVPVITSVVKDYHSATITWTGEGTNYEVNIKESAAPNWPATDIAVTGNSYTFNGLMPATNYMFRVRQDCTADSLDYSEWVIGGVLTDSLPCLTPDSLHATAVTNATATLDWNVNGNENVWDIHVWYGSFDSIYRTILRPATVGGFTAGLTYNAAIRPVCGITLLEGDWSDTVQFTTAVCPDITGLSTSNVTTNSVTLNWNSNPMALRWNIEYGPTGFTQGQGTQAVSNTNSYVVTGLSDGITYDFYVKAVCGDDWTSENWVGTSATTQEGTIPCDAPTGVGTAVADNSVTVNWTAGTGNISFELEYGPRGFSHGAGSTTTATGSPAVIANLDYETQYDVYVRAVCEQNIFSPWSTVSTFTTGERPSEDCDPVQNLTVTNVTETSADISWQPGPTGDHWQVVLTDGTGSTVSDNVTAERQATFSNLTPGTNYTVKVRTDCGDGNYSAYVTANFRTLGGEGIEDVEGINCRIFPNPATSSTTISVTGVNGMVRIAVVDMNGRTVATETLECSADCEKTMEVDKLAQGAYFVRITADSTNMVKKLIVR